MSCDWDCWLTYDAEGRWACIAKSATNLSNNGFTTNQIMTKNASTSCNHVCMDAMQDKQKFTEDEWAVIGIAGSLWPLRVGWKYSAKSAPNLSKYGFATNQIMTKNASTSCNHVCMDAIQDKQMSIGDDEWTVVGIAASLKM